TSSSVRRGRRARSISCASKSPAYLPSPCSSSHPASCISTPCARAAVAMPLPAHPVRQKPAALDRQFLDARRRAGEMPGQTERGDPVAQRPGDLGQLNRIARGNPPALLLAANGVREDIEGGIP